MKRLQELTAQSGRTGWNRMERADDRSEATHHDDSEPARAGVSRRPFVVGVGGPGWVGTWGYPSPVSDVAPAPRGGSPSVVQAGDRSHRGLTGATT